MAKVRLVQLEEHTPWHPGEIVLAQVLQTDVNPETQDKGEYLCETVDTHSVDLKAQHENAVATIDLLKQQLESERTLHTQDRRQLQLATEKLVRAGIA